MGHHRWAIFIIFQCFLLCRRASTTDNVTTKPLNRVSHPNSLLEKHRDACPVSGREDFTSNGSYLYPLEVYYPGIHPKRLRASTVGCYVKDFLFTNPTGPHKQNYSCPLLFRGCPVSGEHISGATHRAQSWKKMSNLCELRNHLSNASDTARVIIFGGSATVGVMAQGCCSRPDCQYDPADQSEKAYFSPACAWPAYFEVWMRRHFSARIEIKNLAFGGYETALSVEKIQEMFSDNGITGLSGRDLILVDHSYNDNIFSKKHLIMSLQRAVETLTRRILHRVTSRHSLPHIVLLEMDPRLVFNDTVNIYTSAYSRVAAHYGLRIYSFKDAILGQTNPVMPMHAHLMGDIDYRNDTHPPWHVHLFNADLIAAILLKEMRTCTPVPQVSPELLVGGPAVKYALPKSQIDIDESKQCNPQYPPVLKLNYDNVVDKTLKSIGSMSIPVNNTWQVRRDRKGRGGFIRELTPESSCGEDNAPIVFTLNMTVGQAVDYGTHLVLQLTYLRSYANSGVVEIDYCGGNVFGGIDALWPDYATHRYTIPQVAIVPLEVGPCRSLDRESAITLVVRHRILDCGFANNDMKTIVGIEPRFGQLFKINSIGVCQYY